MRRVDLRRLRHEARNGWPTLSIGLGSALAAAFVPAWLQELSTGAAASLGTLGMVLLAAGSWAWLRGRAMNRGTAIIVFSPPTPRGPSWNQQFKQAARFTGRGFRRSESISRDLPVEPSQWGTGYTDVKQLVEFHLERDADEREAEDLSLFLLAPAPVAWALGGFFSAASQVDVYQAGLGERGDGGATASDDFFLAVRWRSRLRWGLDTQPHFSPGDTVKLTEVIAKVEGLGEPRAGDADRRAVVLDLARHSNMVADSLKDASDRGIHRALVVSRISGEPWTEARDYFERVVGELGGLLRAFLNQTVDVHVYQSAPVAVSFALGAHLSPPDRFHLMHWVSGGYEEANVL